MTSRRCPTNDPILISLGPTLAVSQPGLKSVSVPEYSQLFSASELTNLIPFIRYSVLHSSNGQNGNWQLPHKMNRTNASGITFVSISFSPPKVRHVAA
ncbi:uncharacterized protein L3040_003211 [Drepanopeziza brunnea f. sp. 'multigermtubi']|uniref:uncharacterized protein n=1 Tax=Drepanopeziza brunnea f. sp. 'multigermtubi' TaxID=698441 RepID=UPI00239AF118|nr:hypothetical protein L3040_003211 [Drepanopeziza brunnea f. sp. 'multigermtubi']